MAITEETRFRLHQRLKETLGEEEALTLMEHLPPVGWADVATKQDLEHLRVATKQDLEHLRVATKQDLEHLRAGDIQGLRKDIEHLRSDMERGFEGIRKDFDGVAKDFAGVHQEIEHLRADMTREFASLRDHELPALKSELEASIGKLAERFETTLRRHTTFYVVFVGGLVGALKLFG